MENPLTRSIYDRSPVLLQHLCSTVFGLKKRLARYGRAFRQYRDCFAASAGWSRAELEAFQDEQVERTVRYAHENVPFYRRRMDSANLRPGDVRAVADLPKLPLLEKADVRQAGTQMLSTALPRRKLRSATTSGSTGFPMVNYWTAHTEQREYGFHWARRRPGVSLGDSYGSFTGLQIVRSDSLKGPFWRFNFAAAQTCYSVFHMTPATMGLYTEQIRRSRHVYLEGYPSPIALLGKFMIDNGIEPPPGLRAVFATAEQLLPEHRQWIEQGFGAKVYDQYGQNEKAGSITQYDCGHMHYDMDYSVIEFLPVGKDDTGRSICEMVCTGFDNLAAPLIRYRIGDMAVLAPESAPCELFASPVVECIHGRTAHALISRDGRQITNISVIAKRCRHVDAMQCVQEQPGTTEIRVVRGEGFSKDDEAEILNQFRQKIGQMDFVIRYVDNVQRSASGKLLSIISKVPPPQQAATIDSQ